jgi:hypothetical protein
VAESIPLIEHLRETYQNWYKYGRRTTGLSQKAFYGCADDLKAVVEMHEIDEDGPPIWGVLHDGKVWRCNHEVEAVALYDRLKSEGARLLRSRWEEVRESDCGDT